MSDKKFIRPANDTKIAGVCAAIANYFDFDVTIVRIVYAVLTVFSTGFPGVILYLILMLVIPKETVATPIEKKEDDNVQ